MAAIAHLYSGGNPLGLDLFYINDVAFGPFGMHVDRSPRDRVVATTMEPPWMVKPRASGSKLAQHGGRLVHTLRVDLLDLIALQPTSVCYIA